MLLMCDHLFSTYAKYSEQLMEIYSNNICSLKYLKIIPFLKSLLNRNSLKSRIFFDGDLQFATIFQKANNFNPLTQTPVCPY